MIGTADFVKKAEEFATEKHFGQIGRDGKPYIGHPRFVASKVSGEKAKVVAWLHDTVEDTDATVEEIRGLFGNEVADAVSMLTHEKGVPYLEYVRNLKGNELAREVKIADLNHNMDVSRLPIITDDDWNRVEKYKKALAILVGE